MDLGPHVIPHQNLALISPFYFLTTPASLLIPEPSKHALPGGLCIPDLSAWKTLPRPQQGLLSPFFQAFVQTSLSGWSLPSVPSVRLQLSPGRPAGPPCPILCSSFLDSTCQHHQMFHVFDLICLLSVSPRKAIYDAKLTVFLLIERQHNVMFMIPGYGVRLRGFEPWFYHLTFLCLSFLIFKMRTVRVLFLQIRSKD